MCEDRVRKKELSEAHPAKIDIKLNEGIRYQ